MSPRLHRESILHRLVETGDISKIHEFLSKNREEINVVDRAGRTSLDIAVSCADVSVEVVRLLLKFGALITPLSKPQNGLTKGTLTDAIFAGDPDKIEALIGAGADVKYRDSNGYDALIHAVHSRGVVNSPRLIELLRLLVRHHVCLNSVTKYNESALRVLSRLGRFDAVQFLLDAGADASQLKWTPLIESVSVGSLDDVKTLLRSGCPLEGTDCWERTAWLIAIQIGDITKADVLRQQGANILACGRCQKPPLFYAIEGHHVEMLRWLLSIGLDSEQADEFGTTSLITAAQADDIHCVEILLAAGVNVDRIYNDGTAISHVCSQLMARRLLMAGANPANLSNEGRRLLAGLGADASDCFLTDVSRDEFIRARTRRFGVKNPEAIQEPFWQAMIRAGVTGFAADKFFGTGSSLGGDPVWCAQRFGQTITLLPDGRVVLIAGEHEDSYDPDFCIYNDVFVHEPGGTFQVFAYPETVFPPTDFHTATLVDDSIYVIGSLGYGREPIVETPVFRMDTRTFRIERLSAAGSSPGWIHRHHATLSLSGEIILREGRIVNLVNGKQVHTDNEREFTLNLSRMEWSVS